MKTGLKKTKRQNPSDVNEMMVVSAALSGQELNGPSNVLVHSARGKLFCRYL